MDKEVIKKNFSKYAKLYDRYATVQNFCASRLISEIEGEGFSKILDVGCGTGNYTRLLKKKFPQAQIKAVDISKEMLDIARKKDKTKTIDFITADGEAIDFEDRFDLISSNAAFQWFEDLEETLLRYRNILNEKGSIVFSIFGPLTFYELNTSLKEFFGKDVSLYSCDFVNVRPLKNTLKFVFKGVEIEQELYRERYDSLSDLLKKIKYTGTRANGLNNRNLWTPKTIDKIEKTYKKRFKNIIATYQIFFCKGVK